LFDGEVESGFRFLQVSTDEVYGSLVKDDHASSEINYYKPNSPYSVSKAASDYLVRAYHHTYGLPAPNTNCSNNYDLYHFPEKLVRMVILNTLDGKPLSVYGNGHRVRDGLYVEDHCSAICCAPEAGKSGEIYHVDGWNERPNRDAVRALCAVLDELSSRVDGKPYEVLDQPGRDRRYASMPPRLSANLAGSRLKPSRQVSARRCCGASTSKRGSGM
jgi:dTDP-glucose 4,6-dehydratase